MGQILLTEKEKETAWKVACGDNTNLVKLSYPDVLLKAQLRKVVKYLESFTFYDDAEGDSAKGLCKHIKQALLEEIK